MADEIRITVEQLATDLHIQLRAGRIKQPALFRNLANMKDARGYPDRAADDQAMRAFAQWLAERIMLSGKRVVRDRPLSPQGMPWQTMEEMSVTPNGKAE